MERTIIAQQASQMQTKEVQAAGAAMKGTWVSFLDIQAFLRGLLKFFICFPISMQL